MFIAKCPVCGSSHTSKNGKRGGVQLYVCKDCRHQFRISKRPSDEVIWSLYQDRKQTISEIASSLSLSVATIKRSLQNVSKTWTQPPLSGGGFVHLDATYWGHNWGVMTALDHATGMPLYMSFIKNETTADYVEAVTSIRERGYTVKGIIIDGKQSLFKVFADYKIQMCQFHMKEIIKRYLTNNPRLKAAQSLKELMSTLTKSTKEDFEHRYAEWKITWDETISKRSVLKSGKSHFKHRRLRSAMHSLDFFLPYLFTFESPECDGMPNTNNKIEGTFTDLKKNLNTHSGMSEENRKRFIIGFFLALLSTHSMKKQDPHS